MATRRQVVEAGNAPTAIGPYSQAISVEQLLFCSGQIPLDPQSGELVGEVPAEQCTQCLRNLAAVCDAAGTSLRNSVRLTIYTTELECFEEINSAYGEFFGQDPPARVAVGVAALPQGALVEVEALVALET